MTFLKMVRPISFLMKATTVFVGAALSFLISGCAMVTRESHLDNKTYRQFTALVQQQSASTKHPLVGIYSLELEADQETLKPDGGTQPLFKIRIAAVHRDSKIEFISLSSLKIDSSEPFMPDHDVFLQGITLWEVPYSSVKATNSWNGTATGVWDGMNKNVLFLLDNLHTGPIVVEIVDEKWLRVAAPNKSYFLRRVSDL